MMKPSDIDLSDLRFVDFGATLEYLRDEMNVSDVMIQGGRVPRVAVCVYGWFHLLKTSAVPYTDQWLESLEQYYSKPGATKDRLERERTLDLAYRLPNSGVGRLHFWMYEGINLSVRVHPAKPPSLDEVLPFYGDGERERLIRKDLIEITKRSGGLLVIGGPVRSGKTWLENALYDEINTIEHEHGRPHLWIIGDPPEFFHEDRTALFTIIDIAERGTDQAAEIRQSLRVPRSLVAVGEMRGDPQSTESALIASLSGSFVTATGHFGSIGQIVSRFSTGSTQMSSEAKRRIFGDALQGIVNVRLLPAVNGGQVLAVEYIDFEKNKHLVTDLLEGRLTSNVATIIDGHRSMRADLESLLLKNRISEETYHLAVGRD